MKTKLLFITALFTLVLSFSACEDPTEQDLKVNNPEMSSDPDEPKPGCDNPNGCF